MGDTTIKFQGAKAGDFKLDASEITVSDEHVKGAEALVQNVYDAVGQIALVEDQLAAMTGERDTLEKRLDEAENISPEKLDAKSEERRVVMDVAEHVGFKRDELRTVGNADIKKLVVQRDDAEVKDDAAVAYVDGCFRQIQKRMDRETDAKGKHAKLGDVTRPNRTDKDVEQHQDGGAEPSYREAAEARMQGLHDKSPAQLKEDGWKN